MSPTKRCSAPPHATPLCWIGELNGWVQGRHDEDHDAGGGEAGVPCTCEEGQDARTYGAVPWRHCRVFGDARRALPLVSPTIFVSLCLVSASLSVSLSAWHNLHFFFTSRIVCCWFSFVTADTCVKCLGSCFGACQLKFCRNICWLLGACFLCPKPQKRVFVVSDGIFLFYAFSVGHLFDELSLVVLNESGSSQKNTGGFACP